MGALSGQMSLLQGLTTFANMAKSYGLSLIPDKEGLATLIEYKAGDVDNKFAAFQHAAAAVDAIENLKDPTKGTLPAKRALLVQLNAQGEAYGRQFQATTDTVMKQQLTTKMTAYQQSILQTKAEIEGLEQELATNKSTMQLTQQTWQTAKADLDQLKNMGPALVERTEALKASKQQQMIAIKQAQKGGSDSHVLLGHLTDAMHSAESDLNATIYTGEAANDATVNVEADMKAQQAASEPDLVSKWTAQG